MFDSVGRNLDQEATKRQAASVLLTMVLLGTLGGSVFLYTVMRITQAVVAPVEDTDDMVEVTMEDPQLDEAPPPPPPPPPPPAAADEAHDEEKTPDPEEPTEEVKPLDEQVKDEVKQQEQPAGQVGGQEGGVEGGQVGGVVGGVVGGELGGQLGGVRTFHHSELVVKRRVQPDYPEAAKALNLGDVDCKVRVFIDEEGVPYDIQIEACPKVFHDSVTDALMKWRWYPAKDGSTKIKAQFLLTVKYKLT